MRRLTLLLLSVAAVSLAVVSSGLGRTTATGPPQPDPNGVIDLPAGYSYTVLAESCTTPVRSTESGAVFAMPDDFDANVLFAAPGGDTWLLSNHELTQPRSGDFQGDAGKCAVDEQATADDGDSDGWGSVSRLVLANDGVTVKRADLITTGLHNLCAGGQTPWKTYLTDEEFPFLSDPEQRSGWIWEIDPASGAAKRATGMGRFSHEQMARVGNEWVETDDRGNFQYLYKFVPDRATDLTTGKLYGLVFNRATLTGSWVGPLDPLAPEADMIARVGPPSSTNSFQKAEGIVPGPSGDAVTFSESASGSDPGRVWVLTDVKQPFVHGQVLAEGDFARLSRPDNLRYTDAGDLFIMEDNGSALGNPLTGGVNQIWLLPRGQQGSATLIHFATLPDGEPTGPWFSFDNRLLYLSIQDQQTAGPSDSRVIAIRRAGNFNQPYDG